MIGPRGEDLTNPKGWRLVDNIVETSKDETKSLIVDRIISINAEISKLLKEKAGLVVGDHPPSFDKFQAHAGLLADSWKQKKNQSGDVRAVFPREFDSDINTAITTLEGKLG